jgi:hypothetical protein
VSIGPTRKNVIEASIVCEGISRPNVLTSVETPDRSDTNVEIVPSLPHVLTLLSAEERDEVTLGECGPNVPTAHSPACGPDVAEAMLGGEECRIITPVEIACLSRISIEEFAEQGILRCS